MQKSIACIAYSVDEYSSQYQQHSRAANAINTFAIFDHCRPNRILLTHQLRQAKKYSRGTCWTIWFIINEFVALVLVLCFCAISSPKIRMWSFTEPWWSQALCRQEEIVTQTRKTFWRTHHISIQSIVPHSTKNASTTVTNSYSSKILNLMSSISGMLVESQKFNAFC